MRATLDGDPAAIRATFDRVERLCRSYDADRGAAVLGPVIDDWGDQLALLRR